MLETKNNGKGMERLLYGIVFLLLMLNGGYIISNDIISSTMTIGLWLAVLACIVYIMVNRQTLQPRAILCMLVLVVCMWLSVMVNGENLRSNFMVTMALVIVCLFANACDLAEFKKIYVKILYFLAVASLIGFALCLLFPSLQNLIVSRNVYGFGASNWIIYVHSLGQTRNMGMYWEPGAYQTFLNLALLFELSGDKPSAKRIVVFVVTVITTFSTTGYIGLALIVVYMLTQTKKLDRRVKFTFSFLIIGILVFILLNPDMFIATDSYTIFGKIITFFEKQQYEGGVTSSANIRFFSITKVFEAFLDSPIFGWGYEGLNRVTYEYTKYMNTCTFANWLAVYGIVYGTVMITGMTKLSRKLAHSKLQTVLIVAILFTVTMSENYATNSMITLFAIYGFTLDRSKEAVK